MKTAPTLAVRPATVDDAAGACDAVRRSITECCLDDHRGEAALLEGWLRGKTPEWVRGIVLAPDAFSVVAEADGHIVGFASARKAGKVTLCYASPDVRFSGAGKAMLAAIEAWARGQGIEALRLESTKTAKSFYLRNGFEPAGEPVSVFGMEAAPMRKVLAAG